MIVDNDLRFDNKTGRYYLTEQYVLNKMGTDLQQVLNDELDTNLSTLAERNIEYSTDIIYDFLEENAISPISSLYHIATNERALQCLKKALEYQLFDYLQNGDTSFEKGNSLKNVPNSRAIQKLDSANIFHIIKRNIPKDIKEW